MSEVVRPVVKVGNLWVPVVGNASGHFIATPFIGTTSGVDGVSANSILQVKDTGDVTRNHFTLSSTLGVAPDGSLDRQRMAADAGPGLGALNVAGIGADAAFRASAVAGEANGTSTAVDNTGWVKSFLARLDVTVVPTGGSPTLNVRIQTQNGSADWQDIASFTQVVGSTTAENVSWGPIDSDRTGIGAEGVTSTFDRFFADQSDALTAANVRFMILGDSIRVSWVFAAGGSSGDYTFAVDATVHA